MSNPTTVANPLAKRLIAVRDEVINGNANTTYVKALAEETQSTKVSEKLECYVITGDPDYLQVSPADAFKAVVYASKPVIGAPVRLGGEIVSSPAPGQDADVPLIVSRPLLYTELLTLYWLDDTVERLDYEEGTQSRVLHAPLQLDHNGMAYELLGESLRKSYYWPTSVPVVDEITPWLTRRPQDRTTLITGLRREGLSVSSFSGLVLNPAEVYEDGVKDLGVCVVSDELMKKLNDEIGLDADPYQGTIWFNDGSFFKGTVQSETSSGRTPGFYGGIKRPQGAKGVANCTRTSIMDSYTMVPWSPSLNRQQTDYSSMVLPVSVQLPSRETFEKAALGFAPYIQKLNDQLISNCGELVRRVYVKGYAGKVAIGTSDEGVQFIISGPDVSDAVRTMVWLFNPTLPVHTSIMKVRVHFRKSTSPGTLIQLNVHESNHDWIERWYMHWAGRDVDGDGAVLTDDPVLRSTAKWPDAIKWHDTTQYKSNKDVDTEDEQTAIRVSTERVRLYSGRIGVYDKLARRIYRQNPDLLTWALRVQLSEAIQRSISAQKKNSGVDAFDGYSWLLKQLPSGSESWLFENVHDHIDELEARTRSFLQQHRGPTSAGDEVLAYDQLLEKLDDVVDEMPQHIEAVKDVLNLVHQIPKEAYHHMKEKGRQLWARHQADATDVHVQDVLAFITRAQHLWRTGTCIVEGDSFTVGFNQKIMIIRTWARQLSARVSTRLLVGAMINHFSLNLLAHVLDIEDLGPLGLMNGYYLPISTDSVPVVGMVGTKGSYAALVSHPYYIDVLKEGHRYRIQTVHTLTGSRWSTRTTHRQKQSTHIINIKEMK